MEEILHQLIWRIYHYFHGFIHPRWCRISSINSIYDDHNCDLKPLRTEMAFYRWRLAAWNLVLEHNQEAVLQHESSMKGKDVRRFWPRPRKPLAARWGWTKNQWFFFMVKRMMVPWKTNHGTWENHPIEKEKHLNQTFMTLGSMLNFGGIWWMEMLCKPWLFVGFVLVLICFDHLWTKGS